MPIWVGRQDQEDEYESIDQDYIGRPRSTALTIAGVLLIIVGGGGIVMSLMIGFLIPNVANIGIYDVTEVMRILGMFSIIGIVLSFGAFAGGYFAIKQEHFVLTIIGSVIALIIGVLSPLFIGSILGLVALIAIAMNHGEFD